MKASELRIGSTYLSTKFGVPVTLELADFDELYHRCDGAEIDDSVIESLIKPIPLTEEWLVKFGFETDHICWFKDGITIGDYKDGFFYIPAGMSFAKRKNPIESVHQLQNLVFALTGEELNV